MAKYKVTLEPMDQYFFGGEMNNKTGDVAKSLQVYYIQSRQLPQQTTLLGMVRFEVLRQASDFRVKDYREYDINDKKKMKDLIGPSSFRIDNNEADYGKIRSLSPIYIVNTKTKERYVRLPLNMKKVNNQKEEYKPYDLSDEAVWSEKGKQRYFTDYEPKEGLASGWINEYGQVLRDHEIFEQVPRVGNRASKSTGEHDEDGFFREDFYRLKKDFAFQLEIDFDGELKDSLVEMGKERSTFRLHIEIQDSPDITKMTQDLLNKEYENLKEKESIIYCLSDVYVTDKQWKCLDEDIELKIIKKQDFRNYYVEEKQAVRSKKKYHMIQRGSIFYVRNDRNKDDIIQKIEEKKNLYKIGYNHVL